MDQKPIKRDPAIVEFSKDHHFALLLCWKIREGVRKTIEPSRISRYVIHFFDNDLTDHFAEEEKLLFSQLAENDPLRLQAEEEHALIRNLVEQIRKNDGEESLLISFADLLDKHIRFEERILFNHLQQALTPDQLQKIAASLHARHHDIDIGWEDVFWGKN